MILYGPREGNRKWLKWNVSWKTKLNHFNLTLIRHFVHSLNELYVLQHWIGCNSYCTQDCIFLYFLIIKNIFKCSMITQKILRNFVSDIFAYNLQSNHQQMMEYLNRSGASPSLDANSQLSSRVCKSVDKTHWWQFYTFIMFYRNNQYLFSSIHFEINFLLFRYWFY